MLVTMVALLFVAQDGGAAAATQPPQRIRNVTIARGEACPRSTAEEIIVCSTLEDPYRIPKALRDAPATDVPSSSWAVRAERALDDQRKVLPGSCSPIGSNGQTGCAQKAAEQWSAEMRARKNGQAVDPQ